MSLVKRALLIPDTHVPFENKRKYDLMLKVAQDFDPHEIVIMGDFLDAYSVSSHAREPSLPRMLEEEINACNDRLWELESLFPKANLIYIEGNHEYRLQRFIRDKAPELFGLVNLKKILKLDNWKWIPYGPEQKYKVLNSKLFVRHEPVGPSANTTAKRSLASVAFGHTHRIEEAQVVGLDGAEYVSFSCGWLGDKHRAAFNFVKNHAQWANGFAVVYVDTKTRYFYHQIIRILENNTCIYNGQRYKN